MSDESRPPRPAHLVRAPPDLLDRVKAAAASEGISVAEWWRRAAKERLDGVSNSLLVR